MDGFWDRLISLSIVLVIYTLLIMFGARVSRIEPRSAGRALATALLGSFVSFGAGYLLLLITRTEIVYFIIYVNSMAMMTKLFFQTSFGKAYLATIIYWLSFVAVIGFVLPEFGIVFAGALGAV